jgi:hypothetical protein
LQEGFWHVPSVESVKDELDEEITIEEHEVRLER